MPNIPSSRNLIDKISRPFVLPTDNQDSNQEPSKVPIVEEPLVTAVQDTSEEGVAASNEASTLAGLQSSTLPTTEESKSPSSRPSKPAAKKPSEGGTLAPLGRKKSITKRLNLDVDIEIYDRLERAKQKHGYGAQRQLAERGLDLALTERGF